MRASDLVARAPTPASLRRFWQQVRGPHRASAARAVTGGAWVAWTLRRRGVRPLVAKMGSERTTTDAAQARRVVDAVDAGLDLLPISPTCLRRSLTVGRELDRLGLAGSVHVGVREVDGRVEAHAWVQAGSEVLNDEPDLVATYTPLATGELERLAALVR